MDQFLAAKAAKITTIVDELMNLGKEGSMGDYTEPVVYHEGVQISLPNGMSDAVALDVLSAYFANKKAIVTVRKEDYGYRPWDVANATARVLARRFGITTSRDGSSVEVAVGVNEKIYVPWGTIMIPAIKGSITIESMDHGDGMGQVGATTIELPRVFEPAARQLNQEIADELAAYSIYRGKAITADVPARFLDPYVTDRTAIVWSASTKAALEGSVINVIRHTDRARSRGMDLHRPVLWYGEPGNGKTETMNIVAQEALENGWSFVQCNGSLRDVISTLRYARARGRHVVAVEDFERLINSATEQDRTDLLEELDGATSKGSEVLLIATTNFLEDLASHQAARRRFFKEIYFGPLDTQGVERLLRRSLRDSAAIDAGNTISADEVEGITYSEEEHMSLDYAKVTRALDGWGNSYIKKVQEFAKSIALSHPEPHLTTADLLQAIEAYRPDWEAYQASSGREEGLPTLDQAFRAMVRDEAATGTAKLAATVDEIADTAGVLDERTQGTDRTADQIAEQVGVER